MNETTPNPEGIPPCPPPPPGARHVLRGATPMEHIARRVVDRLKPPQEAAAAIYAASRTGDTGVWDEAAAMLWREARAAGYALAVWSAGGRVFGLAQDPRGGAPVYSCRPLSTHPLAVMLECLAAFSDPTS